MRFENESAVSSLLLWENHEACKLSSRLSDCWVISLSENVPVSHALLLTEFLCVETALTLLYGQETTSAQLRSHSRFPDRLVILNEDRILSDD